MWNITHGDIQRAHHLGTSIDDLAVADTFQCQRQQRRVGIGKSNRTHNTRRYPLVTESEENRRIVTGIDIAQIESNGVGGTGSCSRSGVKRSSGTGCARCLCRFGVIAGITARVDRVITVMIGDVPSSLDCTQEKVQRLSGT